MRHIGSQHMKSVAAFLFVGSLSGFALGQYQHSFFNAGLANQPHANERMVATRKQFDSAKQSFHVVTQTASVTTYTIAVHSGNTNGTGRAKRQPSHKGHSDKGGDGGNQGDGGDHGNANHGHHHGH